MIILKTVNSLVKVFENEEPSGEEKESVMLKGEKYNFQLVIDNENYVLFNCSVEVTGDIAEYVTVRDVVSLPATVLPSVEDNYTYGNDRGLYPELLKPFGKTGLVLKERRRHAVYVSIDGTGDIPVGKHEIRLAVRNDKGETLAETSYYITVYGEKLADTDLKITHWMHYDGIAEKHGVKLFDDDFYKIFGKYLEAYVDTGNNMLLTPLFTPPLDTYVGGERLTAQLVKVKVTGKDYGFDFSALGKFIDFAEEKGIKYFEMSHLFTQWGGVACPKIIAEKDGKEQRIFGWETDSLSDDYVGFLKAFLPALCDFLRGKGLGGKCYFHLTDEPHATHIERYAKLKDIVKGLIGEFKTMDALSNYEFYEQGLVDVAVPYIPSYEKEFRGKDIPELFVYYCGGNSAYYTGRIFDMPLQRARVLGYNLYEAGVNGFLHWGFNFYNTTMSYASVDPYTDTGAGGGFLSGDSFIVYPDKDGVSYSVRAEALGEGFRDYRLLKTLEKKIGREKTVGILREEGVKNFYEYPRSAERHLSVRKRIIEEIVGK